MSKPLSIKRESLDLKRRKILMEYFRSMDHNRLVSFLNCWLTNKEVKQICDSESIHVK